MITQLSRIIKINPWGRLSRQKTNVSSKKCSHSYGDKHWMFDRVANNRQTLALDW